MESWKTSRVFRPINRTNPNSDNVLWNCTPHFDDVEGQTCVSARRIRIDKKIEIKMYFINRFWHSTQKVSIETEEIKISGG